MESRSAHEQAPLTPDSKQAFVADLERRHGPRLRLASGPDSDPASRAETQQRLDGLQSALRELSPKAQATRVAVLGSAQVTSPAAADVAAATAWTQRRMIFESAPLAAVVEEFNRYNTRRLVVRDPRLSGLHVSGVFSSTDPALLVQFLTMQAEIAVRESDNEIDIDER